MGGISGRIDVIAQRFAPFLTDFGDGLLRRPKSLPERRQPPSPGMHAFLLPCQSFEFRDSLNSTTDQDARAGIITEEMRFVAHRENLGRSAALEVARERLSNLVR